MNGINYTNMFDTQRQRDARNNDDRPSGAGVDRQQPRFPHAQTGYAANARDAGGERLTSLYASALPGHSVAAGRDESATGQAAAARHNAAGNGNAVHPTTTAGAGAAADAGQVQGVAMAQQPEPGQGPHWFDENNNHLLEDDRNA